LSPTQQSGSVASTAGTDTSTIVVERQGISLIATYHGRNNITDESDVWHGLDVKEWQQLMNGLLEYF
jgi:acetylglutamate synthase